MESTTSETNKNSFQRFPPKPHSLSTQTMIDSCQQHLDTFFSTFAKLRIDLLSLIEEYEKLLRGTSLEIGVRNFKDAISWIFEPVEEKTLSLSAIVKTAFSELSDVITQRNRGKEPANSRLSNGNDIVANGIEHTRATRKISKQEINVHKVRLLQPCVEQLIELLSVFFDKGQQIYSLQEQTSPRGTTPSEQDMNQLPAFFPSLPQILQVPTAHWFVASQTSAEMRQQDFRLPLGAPDPVFARQQLLGYVQFLEKTPFKRFQVMGGFQCNPSDMCRALERCATEEELAQLSEYFLRRGEEIREGVVTCEIPQNTSYVIGDREISSEEGSNIINYEIEQFCERVCVETAGAEAKRLAEFVTYEVCSDMLERSSYVSVLLLYGKAYLVDIAEYIANGSKNKIVISQMDDKQGVRVEELRTWKIVPSNALENWNVVSKDPLATLATCYKKDFQLTSTDNSFILETVDVKILSINHGWELDKPDTSVPLLSQPRHAPTHRTYSLPIESNGEGEKPHSGHPALQHTLSLHFSEDAGMRGHPSGLGSSRSKTGSLESISSVSTLKAINPDFGLSTDGADDVRQQLFQDTTLQHLQNRKWIQPQAKGPDAWPREDAREEHFFLNLFSKINQDLNAPNQEEKKTPQSLSKDKPLRVHKRNFSIDSSHMSVTGAPPEKHQSVSNLSLASENTAADISHHWMSSLSSDNLTKCQSWPSLCGVLELDSSAPSKDTGTPHHESRGTNKLEDSIDSSRMSTVYSPFSLEDTGAKEFHCSDSELWPSKGIWGDEGLGESGSSKRLPRSASLSSDSESCASDSDTKESFSRPKELTRAKYKPVYSENKPSKSKHPFSRPPPFSPANSPQPRPIYHQPSPPPPHWEPPRNPHPPHPPPGWNGTHWHEGAPPMHMPPMHGPHPPGQWGPPPPPPHHHPLSHPPHQGPPPHFPYHSAPPPPHYPPPIGLHSTPSPLPAPPESPRAPPPLPPHQGIHPNVQPPPLQHKPTLHPPTSTCPPHSPQIPSPTPPRTNSPVPPNQQYPPYGPPMHRSLMDPNHPHNHCPPPYYVQRMPHPHHNYYPIPNSNW